MKLCRFVARLECGGDDPTPENWPQFHKCTYSHVCVQATPQNEMRKYYKRNLKNVLHLYLVYCQNSLYKSSFNQVRFVCYAMSYLAFHIHFGRITRFVLHIALLWHIRMNGRWPSFLIRHSGVFQMNNRACWRVLIFLWSVCDRQHAIVDNTKKNLKRELPTQYDHSNILIYTAICNFTYCVWCENAVWLPHFRVFECAAWNKNWFCKSWKRDEKILNTQIWLYIHVEVYHIITFALATNIMNISSNYQSVFICLARWYIIVELLYIHECVVPLVYTVLPTFTCATWQ